MENRTDETEFEEELDASVDEVVEDTDSEESEELSPDSIEVLPGDDGDEILMEDYNELNDRYLRLAAEYDNYRKRTTREKDDFAKFASTSLIEKLLPVLDTAQRGVEFNEKAQDIEAIKEGMVKVHKMFFEVLQKEGLDLIDEKEVPFDINLHMAVFQEEREDVEDSLVLEVFEKGYSYKGKVLRPAKVKVSKNSTGKVTKPEQGSLSEAQDS